MEEIYLLDLLPGTSWATVIRLEYGSLLIIVAASAMFLAELFPGDQPPLLIRAYAGASLAGLAAIALLPPQLFTRGLPALQFLCVSAAVVAAVLVGRSLLRGREGAGLFLFGELAIAVTGIHDVLISIYRSLPTGTWLVDSIYLQPFGLFAFVLSQAILLARRSSRALRRPRSTLARAPRGPYRARPPRAGARAAGGRTDLRARIGQPAARAPGLGRRPHRPRQPPSLRRGAAPLPGWIISGANRRSPSCSPTSTSSRSTTTATAIWPATRRCAASPERWPRRCCGPGDVVARYGGEELVALLPNTDTAGARLIAERIRAAVAATRIPHEASSVDRHVTVSIGVAATIPTGATQREALIERADLALYRAKELGRDRVVVSETETLQSA